MICLKLFMADFKIFCVWLDIYVVGMNSSCLALVCTTANIPSRSCWAQVFCSRYHIRIFSLLPTLRTENVISQHTCLSSTQSTQSKCRGDRVRTIYLPSRHNKGGAVHKTAFWQLISMLIKCWQIVRLMFIIISVNMNQQSDEHSYQQRWYGLTCW